MAGINVKQQVIQEFTDSFGNEIHEGDLLLLSTKKAEKNENILCIFKGTKGQYLVTATVERVFLNQYRLSSVDKCRWLRALISKKKWRMKNNGSRKEKHSTGNY